MKHFCFLFVAFLTISILPRSRKKSVQAIKISTAPKIDGLLDDDAWKNIRYAMGFAMLGLGAIPIIDYEVLY